MLTIEDYKSLCQKNEQTKELRKGYNATMIARIEHIDTKANDIILMYKDYKILKGYTLSEILELVQESMLVITNISKLKILVR